MKAAVKTGKTKALPLFNNLVELAKTKLHELVAYAKANAAAEAAVEKAQKAFDGCKKFAAKVMAAMKVAHEHEKTTGNVSPDMPFSEYYEQKVGAKPNTHILSMATAFNRLVETGHVTEAVMDCQPNDAWEKANEAITAIIDKYKGTGTDPKTSPEFKRVVDALTQPGEAVKTLKDLKAEVKPSKRKSKSEDKDDEKNEPFTLRVSKLTAELALQLLGKIAADGQLAMCIRDIPDEMAKMTPENRRSILLAMDDSMSDIWKRFAAEMTAVVNARDAQRKPVQVLQGGQPATENNKPGIPTPELAAA